MSYVVVTYSPNLETFLLWEYDLLLEVQPCLSTNAWRKKEKMHDDKSHCLDLAQMKLAKCSSLEKERAQMKGYTKKNK